MWIDLGKSISWRFREVMGRQDVGPNITQNFTFSLAKFGFHKTAGF